MWLSYRLHLACYNDVIDQEQSLTFREVGADLLNFTRRMLASSDGQPPPAVRAFQMLQNHPQSSSALMLAAAPAALRALRL